MKNSDKYFQLSRKAATVLCMKFVEIIISSKNKEEISDEIITKNLNSKEIFIKLRHSSKNIEESQQAMSLIIAGKLTERNLIPTYAEELCRGGLWEVSDDMENVFMITEKYFSIQTSKGLRCIQIDTMVGRLKKFAPLVLTFNNIVENIDLMIDKKVEIKPLVF